MPGRRHPLEQKDEQMSSNKAVTFDTQGYCTKEDARRGFLEPRTSRRGGWCPGSYRQEPPSRCVTWGAIEPRFLIHKDAGSGGFELQHTVGAQETGARCRDAAEGTSNQAPRLVCAVNSSRRRSAGQRGCGRQGQCSADTACLSPLDTADGLRLLLRPLDKHLVERWDEASKCRFAGVTARTPVPVTL